MISVTGFHEEDVNGNDNNDNARQFQPPKIINEFNVKRSICQKKMKESCGFDHP